MIINSILSGGVFDQCLLTYSTCDKNSVNIHSCNVKHHEFKLIGTINCKSLSLFGAVITMVIRYLSVKLSAVHCLP